MRSTSSTRNPIIRMNRMSLYSGKISCLAGRKKGAAKRWKRHGMGWGRLVELDAGCLDAVYVLGTGWRTDQLGGP